MSNKSILKSYITLSNDVKVLEGEIKRNEKVMTEILKELNEEKLSKSKPTSKRYEAERAVDFVIHNNRVKALQKQLEEVRGVLRRIETFFEENSDMNDKVSRT